MKLMIFCLLKLIVSLYIKEAPIFTKFDIKNYYISSEKKIIFIINSSTKGNIILQVFDKKIDVFYICLNHNNIITLKSCKQYFYSYNYANIDLGYFKYSKIYFVSENINSVIIKILNTEEIYSNIEVKNNQEIKCFNFYHNTKGNQNSFKFNLKSLYDSKTTINIQYNSNKNKNAKLMLYNKKSLNYIYSISDKYINNFIDVYFGNNYILEFTPSYDANSLLCLSFSPYEMYYISENNNTIPIISPGNYIFYTYLLNSSNIKGKKYITNFEFFFNSVTYKKNYTCYERKLNNDTYQERLYCYFDHTNKMEFTIENDIVIYLKIYLIPGEIGMEYNNNNTISFRKILEEIDYYDSILYFLEDLNSSLYIFFPIIFCIIIIIFILMSYECKKCCQCECCECCSNCI